MMFSKKREFKREKLLMVGFQLKSALTIQCLAVRICADSACPLKQSALGLDRGATDMFGSNMTTQLLSFSEALLWIFINANVRTLVVRFHPLLLHRHWLS